ncbi:glycosyltransferase [Comamonas piscis]|uniref:Glycosyltransferase n=1 Tax=Comamonas piscis TaxID=1562974 RepID=A0A7G5EHL5_9BURK|nr:glycosyltransferase [Comamonas piscis]QMV73490.1 glycosyltransferase [Comamonas piscis]WSO31907.1 glycosyltransferase [Comamonas piscis]
MLLPTAKTLVLMPYYEDTRACQLLLQALRAQLGPDCFVLFVDDCSPQQPLTASALADAGLPGRILRLRRNAGHQQALALGLQYLAPHLQPQQQLVLMDSDGEDAPEAIPGLLAQLSQSAGAIDAVVAARGRRRERWTFVACYRAYQLLFRLSTGRVLDFGNFMVLSASGAQALAARPSLPVHMAASLLASDLRLGRHTVDRAQRYAGVSKMNLSALVGHGLRAIRVFKTRVLQRLRHAALLLAGLAAVLAWLSTGQSGSGMALFGFWGCSALALLCVLLYGLLAWKLASSYPQPDMAMVAATIDVPAPAAGQRRPE